MSHTDEIRSFIAIPLPDEIKQLINQKISTLRTIFPSNSIKWVQANNIHLTLKFLGNQSKSVLNELINKLEAAQTIERFTLSIEKLGAFPSIYKPNVIWIGVSTHKNLEQLNKKVGLISYSLINDIDNKGFSPHLTIARIKAGMHKDQFEVIKKGLFDNRELPKIDFPVNHFSVYKSTLTPQGAIYNVLHRFDLSE